VTKADLTTTEVLVVRNADGSAQLVPARAATCRSCGLCGADAAFGADSSAVSDVPLSMSLPSRSLLLMALAMYGVPFAGLLLGAMLAAVLEAGDVVAAIISLGGCLLAGFAAARLTRGLERQAIDSIIGISLERDRASPEPVLAAAPAEVARC
jgi:positive regulator of sigma E activity